MSQREFLIILAHTHACAACRAKLLADATSALAGRPLSATEKMALSGLTFENYITPDSLARAAGVSLAELEAHRDEGVVRLRHL
jgi:hypothetical protein